MTRECNKDYKYKDITIPKGSVVAIPNLLLQMDPKYWDDPEKYDPMRYESLCVRSCQWGGGGGSSSS